MYFGGHKVHPSTEKARSFLRLPASDAQHADVIGELKAIITLTILNEADVPCVVLHHWVMENRPHFTEGLPRVFPTPSTLSCVRIDSLIDRVRFAAYSSVNHSAQRASVPHIVPDYTQRADYALNAQVVEIGYSGSTPQRTVPVPADERPDDD